MRKALILVCMFLLVSPALAKEKNKEHSSGNSSHTGKSQHAQSQSLQGYQYNQKTIQGIIDSYFLDQSQTKKSKKNGKKKKNLPPGLQKKLARGGELPPGWQKKVARGEVLAGPLYSRSVKLPHDLLRRLPAAPPGSEYLRLEDRIFRILDDSRKILDIFTIN